MQFILEILRYVKVHKDGVYVSESLVGSVGEDKIRELLRDSRATSRASLRSNQDVVRTVSRSENGDLSSQETTDIKGRSFLAQLANSDIEISSARTLSRQDSEPRITQSRQLSESDARALNGVTGPTPGSDELMTAQSARFSELMNNVRIDLSETEDHQPFLPEINHSGQLSTLRQGGYRLNNEDQARANNSTRGSANVLRNNITDNANGVVMDTVQNGNTTPTPHPPSGTRTNSGGRHRNLTNFSRNSFD